MFNNIVNNQMLKMDLSSFHRQSSKCLTHMPETCQIWQNGKKKSWCKTEVIRYCLKKKLFLVFKYIFLKCTYIRN